MARRGSGALACPAHDKAVALMIGSIKNYNRGEEGNGMSKRIHESWTVFNSIENREHDRCVDLFHRPDDTYGFEEFRRDVEDAGAWTPVQYYSHASYPSKESALSAATEAVPWLAVALSRQRPN